MPIQTSIGVHLAVNFQFSLLVRTQFPGTRFGTRNRTGTHGIRVQNRNLHVAILTPPLTLRRMGLVATHILRNVSMDWA